MKPILVSFVALCYVATLVQVQTTFIDSDDGIEQVAEAVCKNNKGTKQQLGHLSTLNKLVDYLGGLSSGHQLYNCRSTYLESIEQLVKVVETASGDVCGDEKLALIEGYHQLYVSKVRKYVKQQSRHNKAPKMVKLLFMRYAGEVSSACAESALASLANNKQTYKAEDLAKVEELRKFTDALGMTNLKKGYRGIYLFWNMVDSLDLSNKDKFSPYLTKEGRSGRINLQMKNAKGVKGLQALCQYHLKPVYGKTLLPVIRLIDIGYYPSSARLVENLNTPSEIRSLFFATQICETIIPVEVFEDESLQEDHFMALTIEEASKLAPFQLDGIEELKKLEPPTVDVSPRSVNVDDLTASDVTAIKLNIADRSKVINMMLKQLLSQTKKKLKSLFKGMKVIRKSDNQKLQQDDEEILDQIDSQGIKVQVDDDERDGGLVRTRRNIILEGLGGMILVIGFIIYTIVLFLLKLAILTVPTIALLPVVFFGTPKVSDWAFDHIATWWMFGTL